MDAIKTSVEWFFGIEENPFEYYSKSGVKSFKKGTLHNRPPRYGDEILQFSFQHAEKILNLYKEVNAPDPQIIDVLEKLIDAKEKTREKAEEIARIEQNIKTLQSQSAELDSEIQTAFINPLVDASQGAKGFIRRVCTIHQGEAKRQNRIKKEFAKNKAAIFGFHKNIEFQFNPADADCDEANECFICKEKSHMYIVLFTENNAEDDDDITRSTVNYCCNCFEKNINQNLQGKVF